MTELEIAQLERNIAKYGSYKEEESSADDTGNNLGEEVKNILTTLEADEEIDNLEKEKVDIIEEVAEMLKRRQKDKLTALRDIPKKKLLEETSKVDKVLFKFQTHSMTKSDEWFYAGAAVVTNRLGVKINKATKRKETMWWRL